MGRMTLVLLAVAFSAAACSTHEEEFSSPVPPSANNQYEAVQAAIRAPNLFPSEPASLRTSDLAKVSSAAATIASVSTDPRDRIVARSYGDSLLLRGINGSFGQRSGEPADARSTAMAGDALLDLFLVLRDRRYLRAAYGAAQALSKPRLGWRRSGGAGGIASATRAGIDILSTALTFRLFWRLSELTPLNVREHAAAALRTLVEAQEAVGRWYAITGSRKPMNLWQWAVTLDACLIARDTEAEGLAGGGIEGIWRDVFGPGGQIRNNSLTRGAAGAHGLAASLDVFAQYGNTRFAEATIPRLVSQIRGRAARADVASRMATNAHLASALARRLAQLERAS